MHSPSRLSAALPAVVSLTCCCLLASVTLLPTHSLAQSNPATTKPAGTDAARSAVWWTDAARILAGLEPNAGSELGALAKRVSVDQHRKAFGVGWQQFEASRLAPAMKFARTEITQLPAAKGPIYYPFSGPDAMYAVGLFPEATAFALAGLEPVGEVPDIGAMPEANLSASLAELRRSLNSIKAFSFFRTNDMRDEFGRNRFSGVTPIILLFLARHDMLVQAVEPVVMDANAQLREVRAADLRTLAPNTVAGVRIRFAKAGETTSRTLYYFAADLSDQGLAKGMHPVKWAEGFAPKATYLKSASYLMHKTYFSKIREFILTHSALVVQDDSGIPLRFFPEAQWERTFFGTYDGPIQLFANWYQKDLRAAYVAAARPLDFGIGYDFQAKTSNIQRFVRKGN